jgi:hypothetical protein
MLKISIPVALAIILILLHFLVVNNCLRWYKSVSSTIHVE